MTGQKSTNRDRAAYMRAYRTKRRGASAPAPAVIPPFPSAPAGELARWSRDVLRLPAGHPEAGEPMILPDGTSAKDGRFIALS